MSFLFTTRFIVTVPLPELLYNFISFIPLTNVGSLCSILPKAIAEANSFAAAPCALALLFAASAAF